MNVPKGREGVDVDEKMGEKLTSITNEL